MKRNKTERLAAKAAATSKEETKVIAIETAAPAPAKKVTLKEKEVDKVNATATVAKITEKKELKYKYPADCEESEGADKQELLDRRKKFRATVRRTLKSFDKKIAGLQKSNLEEDLKLMGKVSKEIEKYRKSVLANPVI